MDIQDEGEGWFTLMKPAGLSVFPLHHQPDSDCVLRRLLDLKPTQNQQWPSGYSGGICHRLDIPTSGQLLVAKSPIYLTQIRQIFTLKKWKKNYVFLSAHRSEWESMIVGSSIGHHPKSKKKMVVERHPHTRHRGKWYPAQTHFSYLTQCGAFHAYTAIMQTGVMHQVRVHASFAGVPLAGDKKYGGRVAPSLFKSEFALHHMGMASDMISPQRILRPSWWPNESS